MKCVERLCKGVYGTKCRQLVNMALVLTQCRWRSRLFQLIVIFRRAAAYTLARDMVVVSSQRQPPKLRISKKDFVDSDLLRPVTHHGSQRFSRGVKRPKNLLQCYSLATELRELSRKRSSGAPWKS